MEFSGFPSRIRIHDHLVDSKVSALLTIHSRGFPVRLISIALFHDSKMSLCFYFSILIGLEIQCANANGSKHGAV